ncbi:MAG: hypothetical protein JKX99_10060 [Robiginitomaculum sp.]|nr:hypothetical protein [Robiginitomaculum sp.]
MNKTATAFIGEGELPVLLGFSYCEGRPAKLNGPMEDSHPAEDSELELYEVIAMPNLNGGFEIIDTLSTEELSRLEDICDGHAVEDEMNYSEQKADYDRETQQENRP